MSQFVPRIFGPTVFPGARVVLGLLGLAMIGCDRAAPDRGDAPIPKAAAISETAAAGAVLTESVERSFQGITLTIPAGWEERPLSSEFVQGEFRIPGIAGEARVTLSSAGGTVEANLDRWRNQFRPGPNDPQPVETTVRVGDVDAVVIELQGTFSDSMSGGNPRPQSMMLGAVIPTGPANFFVKATGPRDTVTAHRDELLNLIKSARLR